MTLTRSFVALALAAGLSTGALASTGQINVPAHRDGDSNTQTTAVNSSDLNLASVDGRADLRSRIDVAVREVCTFGTYASVDKGCTGDAKLDAQRKIEAIIASAHQQSVEQPDTGAHGAN